MNIVRGGISTHVFVNAEVIFGNMNVSMKMTISKVMNIRITGYIRAHLIFDLSSMLSRSFLSSSKRTLGRFHVFSQTSISEIIRGSKYLAYCLRVSEMDNQWFRFHLISFTICLSLGFLTCFVRIQKDVLRSIQLVKKLHNLLMNCQISFQAIHQMIMLLISLFIFIDGFFPVFIQCRESWRICMNGAESKFQFMSKNFLFQNILDFSVFKNYIHGFLNYDFIFSFLIKLCKGLIFSFKLLFHLYNHHFLFIRDGFL